MNTKENHDDKPLSWHSPQAAAYQENIRSKIIGYDVLHELMLHISRAYKKPDRMLIVGAGGGQELLVLGKEYPFAQYTALDPSEIMLSNAQAAVADKLPTLSVAYYPQYLSQLKLDEPFQLATCQLVLHYVPSLEQKQELLLQLADCLHESAPLFVSAIMCPSEEQQFQWQMSHWRQSISYHGITDEHWQKFSASFGESIYPITSEQLQLLLLQAGFTTVIPYFKSHLIEGYVAVKKRVKERGES